MATVDSHSSIIRGMHVAIGHRGEKKTHKKVHETYSNITLASVRSVIATCAQCAAKPKNYTNRNTIRHPISTRIMASLNSCGQVDLLDYGTEPDGEYCWVLHYRTHLTKFSFLRPLAQKQAALVAKELVAIFLTFSAPRLLQSNNGSEFCVEVIKELKVLWPSLKLKNGQSCYPQLESSMASANVVMKDLLTAWMQSNHTTKWATGLPFIQWKMNTTQHKAIKMSPYEAVFGQKARIGSDPGSRSFSNKLHSGMMEEDVERMIAEESNEVSFTS